MHDDVTVDNPAEEETQSDFVVSQHKLRADQLLTDLNDLMNQIPGLTGPDVLTKAFELAHRTVPDDFIYSMAPIVAGTRALDSLGIFDPAAAHDMIDFNRAYDTIADRLEGLAKQVRFTMGIKKAVQASAALQAYGVLKLLARGGDLNAQVRVKQLAEKLGRKGRKKRKLADE